ncbi:MAG TPA: D-aminoacyl-tRNA deacylase [Polyangia bacterium]
MITLVQRVSRAEVRVAGEVVGRIDKGLLLFVGVERGDTEADADATARKVAALRIFAGRHPMDLAVKDVGGACLVVSQFTLAGSIRKGNRPGFEGAEAPERAKALYERVAAGIAALEIPVATGQFAADMDVDLVNDGPVTFVVIVRDGSVQKTER